MFTLGCSRVQTAAKTVIDSQTSKEVESEEISILSRSELEISSIKVAWLLAQKTYIEAVFKFDRSRTLTTPKILINSTRCKDVIWEEISIISRSKVELWSAKVTLFGWLWAKKRHYIQAMFTLGFSRVPTAAKTVIDSKTSKEVESEEISILSQSKQEISKWSYEAP